MNTPFIKHPFTRLALTAALASSLTGCLQTTAEKSMDQQLALQEKLEAKANARAEKSLSQAPQWFLTPLPQDIDWQQGVYGQAAHWSRNLNSALEDATSLALGNAQEKISVELSRLKQVVRTPGKDDPVTSLTQEQIIKRASIRSMRVVEQFQHVERGGYMAYVRVMIPTQGLVDQPSFDQQIQQLRQLTSVDLTNKPETPLKP
ncbi:MAG: hypothetical protein M1572_00440 [Gammaproteobacteria bacterium]|jgi:hypothetical protein|nr:hypothetical protein [Gammaproteobacteria bacterium]OYZ05422.1 MAG: hypothetical protein B7Y29_06215 [Thiotrichales bacterium 16-46-22]OZB86857.1 MAG: hypothetical protein B7Z48_02955 [Thiotrichales bacterium 12-47-6]UCG18850.1 MAG: hypothetical protein JSU84_01100 [Thiotrichales bacterium]HQT02319.1 hypothetical protein [Thiotrichales bacterium]